MDMTTQQAETMVENLRLAHRMSVGFYQRLLPLLAEVANGLELDFWYWEPAHTSRPGASTTAPMKKWSWDMVPMFASSHVYRRVQGGTAAKGDLGVMFRVYMDDAFKPDERKRHGIRGEPDPLVLPAGRAVVETYIARCIGDHADSFEKTWHATGWPSPGTVNWEKLHDWLEACTFTHSLAGFISKPDDVVADIRRALTG